MQNFNATKLTCPIDGDSLVLNEKQLQCCNGHSFDIARQGYVNLLPVQHKRSKEPGDSKEMVVARTLFLNSDIYLPIAKKLLQIVKSKSIGSTLTILDAGCGEGYYLDYIINSLKATGLNPNSIGLDISKHAIIAAARRNKNITWLVASNRQPPVISNSVDIIICVFGFQSFEGFNKILQHGGLIILVDPGPNHLKELRNIIYNDIRESEPTSLVEAEKLGFNLVDTQQLQFKTGDIDNSTIQSLLLMTPHFFRANKAGRDAAIALQNIDLSVDVVFRVLKR
ncbi:Ribosomal RNA large subunit methyltransferase A [hydrothermal vent metagenome]|uniref:Ribosomal RNA large subunit methyltransferase A n=1 Tax=hydrothermal vent metagenome TaxID=652676 RepID=A0A3B1AE05_9ZZZZ